MGCLRHPGRSRAADSTARAALYLHRWLGAFDSVGYLPPWNWAWAIPVTAGFGLVWAAADTLARSAWLARWQVTDEPRRPRGSRAGPPVAHRRGSPAKTAG